ncbi:MAG: hypothetical protein CM1200mP14_07250 [Gammaproteobacteria bacterium]|nr:MAG: hypothetical protein CM1200mP14_07250 [Gammaproteobacteria bacterium]
MDFPGCVFCAFARWQLRSSCGMLNDLRSGVGPDCEVDAYTDLVGFIECWKSAVASEAPELVTRVGGHADIAESSEMLCIRPDLGREDLAEEGTRRILMTPYLSGFLGTVFVRLLRMVS